MVAGMLELATSPIFGAGIPTTRFTAAEWEALSAAVVARVGCHAPSLDRARPLRDVFKDFMTYFDGWCRIENGLLRPGFFPHDGTIPAGLTELSVHDFVERPRVKAATPSKTVNDVVIVYRDGHDMLKKKPANDSASDNVEARRAHETAAVEMLGIIDPEQAQAFAAEAAATGAEGEWDGTIKVRRPRAVWADSSPLQAGDNFNLDLIAPQVDQVSRITRRTDPYSGSPTLEIVAERGVFPTPYRPPADLRPNIGKIVPLEIAHARVLELTPALAGTPLGLPVSFLAMRPRAQFDGVPLNAANVLGFNVWYSAAGASYDSLGHMVGWAVRGTLRVALAEDTADVTVQLAMDADNLDLGRLASQSAEGQANDNLLLVLGDEIFSVGAITIAALNCDFACKRVRQGSLPAAHALNAEAWLIYRDELAVFTHRRFVEDQDRYFKLQPYTASAAVELADVDALLYHFRDRADELPVVVIDVLPAAMRAGLMYFISGSISDVNGDLTNYEITAARIVGGNVDSEITLRSASFAPDERALFAFKAPVIFPQAGTWRIVVRAYDERVGFTEVQTADFVVAAGSGLVGPDDGITPDAASNVTVTPGFGMLVLEWDNPVNTPLLTVRIYESVNNVRPASPTYVLTGTQDILFREGLGNNVTRYFWIEVEATNKRLSAIAGPYNGTTIDGITLSHLVPGMELVSIVNALPNPVGYTGAKVVFLTTDGKLYRLVGGAWTTAVAAVDLTGQIVSGQIADNAILQAKLADNSISQAKLQDNIVSTAKLVDSAITNVKIAAAAIDANKLAVDAVTSAAVAAGAITNTKIADDSISTAKLSAGSVTAAKIGAGEVVAGKIAAGAVRTNELAANSITAAKIGAGEVTAGKIAAGAVSTNELAANAVTAAKIGAGEITTAKLAAGAVTANELAANSVTAAKIGAGEVTTAKLAASAVTANELAANAVTAGKIAAAAVTATAVGANEVIAQTANIANGVITSAKIADLAAGKITAGTIAAQVALSAPLIATAGACFNTGYPSSTFPTVACQMDSDSTQRNNFPAGGTVVSFFSFWGWQTGTGYANDRYGRSDPRFYVAAVVGFSNIPSGNYASVELVYSTDGGTTWDQVNGIEASIHNPGTFVNVSGAFALAGMSANGRVDLGIRLKSPSSASQFEYGQLMALCFNF
ncbi:MAG: hypothetical protein HZA93_13320 [Verrucomicrobia bacterium]|nr:hypothetical protein [Verrucomicrobiota bacterium]